MNGAPSLLLTVLCAACCCFLPVSSGFRLPGRTTRLGTFNAALLPQYGALEERTEILINLIRESELDVICLQEIWKGNIQRRIYQEVRDLYPYHVSTIDLTTENVTAEPACSALDVQRYGTCLFVNCSAPNTPQTCIISECLHIINELSDECITCLTTNVGTPGIPPGQDIAVCAAQSRDDYAKTFGLMLLSRKQLKKTSTEGYLGELSLARGYYKASIEEVGHLYCTHLSTTPGNSTEYVGPPFVTPLLYDTYSEQQYAELVDLLDLATSATDSAILLGDFNHGPALATPLDVSSIVYDFPFNYGYVNARGYFSPYVIFDGRCTFCSENPTVSLQSRVIDHVYVPVTANRRVVAVKRFWDDQYTEEGLPLSDHYGIQIVLRDLTSCTFDYWFCLFREGMNTFPTLQHPNNELGTICTAVDADKK